MLSYGLLAYSLPPGHVFQARIDGLEGFSDLTTASENVQRAVREFANPDVESPRKATAVALGEKVKKKAPAPRDTAVTVLNGNGVSGSASEANYLLGQRHTTWCSLRTGFRQTLRPTTSSARSSTSTPAQAGSKLAAEKLAALFGSADTKVMTPAIQQLANGSMLVAVVGQTFHGRLASAPVDQTPERTPAAGRGRNQRRARASP